MPMLLMALIFSAAAATTDCRDATDPSSGACVDSSDTTQTTSNPGDAPTAPSASRADPAAGPSDDEPWTYETDLEAQHVCLTRSAGGICLETDE